MRTLLAAVLLASAAALAGCGPDCAGFCAKLRTCAQAGFNLGVTNDDASEQRCVQGCNDSGQDEAHTIQCVINHTCTDINAGHCSVTGGQGNP